ncbi:MAG: SRPBCC family protein [Deltaproteobacteria bacterium]|nr:SRPBCC family protein [Deltaproteobacteria bacterium]
MIFEDTFTVKAPIQKIWGFLLDPQKMASCIPGAEKIDVIDERNYHVVAGAKVSFLSVSFAMKVTVTEMQPPTRLVSVGEGMDQKLKDRVKLTTELNLREVGPQETEVSYKIDMAVFGKLASIGFSVIKGKAKRMAGEFTNTIKTRLEAEA